MNILKLVLVGLLVSLVSLYAKDDVSENGKGFYLGAGVGASFYNISVSDGVYYIPDNDGGTHQISISEYDNLDDNDIGYLIYAGYQFNKIIAIEASYTDYGAFSDQITNRAYTKDPTSMALYANAGYTFLNGQVRPFGILGLGYMNTNQSTAYDLKGAPDSFMTFHAGLGVDYYPKILNGFGFRLSYVGDSSYDSNYVVYDTANTITTTSLWQYYGLLYIGAQYKF